MNHVTKLNEIEDFRAVEGLNAKVLHTFDQTYAFWKMEKGTLLPDHHHVHTQVSIVTKGRLQLTIDDHTSVVEKGQVATIPSGALHGAVALTDVEIIDVFTPKRLDLIGRTI